MHARLDEAEAVFAARLFEIPRSVELAQRSLQTLEELGVDARYSVAGAYARVVLFTADYAYSQKADSQDYIPAFREFAGEHLVRTAEIFGAQTTGIARFARGNLAGACTVFEDALEMIGPDAYLVPALRCFLGIGLRGQVLEAATREQFVVALERGSASGICTAVAGATYELRPLEGDNPSTQQCREALETLALEFGSRRTVGCVAIIEAIQYLDLGLLERGSQLMRIGVAMLWDEADAAERQRTLSTISQAYTAFGLIEHAPQIFSLLAPRPPEKAA